MDFIPITCCGGGGGSFSSCFFSLFMFWNCVKLWIRRDKVTLSFFDNVCEQCDAYFNTNRKLTFVNTTTELISKKINRSMVSFCSNMITWQNWNFQGRECFMYLIYWTSSTQLTGFRHLKIVKVRNIGSLKGCHTFDVATVTHETHWTHWRNQVRAVGGGEGT